MKIDLVLANFGGRPVYIDHQIALKAKAEECRREKAAAAAEAQKEIDSQPVEAEGEGEDEEEMTPHNPEIR